jgi:hypothetical protein
MGAYCNANRKIYFSNNQIDLINNLEEEISQLKLRRKEEIEDNLKNNVPLHKRLKIDLIPSCEQILENLRVISIPDNLFDDARTILSSFFNYVEDDDYENAIKIKNEYNAKFPSQPYESITETLPERKEIKLDSGEESKKPLNDVKS